MIIDSTQVLKLSDLHCDEGYIVPSNRNYKARLIEDSMLLGRSRECDFSLSDHHISLRHCQIEKRPLGFFLKDLESRNGTFVNGIRVKEARLNHGVEILIGKSRFNFVVKSNGSASECPSAPMISKNDFWRDQLENVKSIADSSLPVFLSGESGTGKEVLAKIIHEISQLSSGPFVSVNCGALTESLVESELFGHIKGSFTGATSDRRGAFESARNGTLFLDEIGDLPMGLQSKILRALENKEIKPLGSDKTVTTNVRIITATHKDLDSMVLSSQFRADLFYRIHVIRIDIPALRDRMEDFDELLYKFSKEFRVGFSHDAICELKKYSWPGNIRELRNVTARARAVCPGAYVEAKDVEKILNRSRRSRGGVRNKFPAIQEIERDILEAKFFINKGNQRKTARDLGVAKSTLHDRLKKLKIRYNPK